ncbi:hypothetical protein [Flavobacterium humidisoli]|uniref:Uncharacterized protein n=1 Tax=Flavobacterium humidisoli TaxID=2937442 RepID=A0ABY4LXI1_9FLAO|nr:hypothetical protein [Flavobacterium humidisoli]UPZ17783.1 hypothetical protein M0M44_10635 [Flavobacterium humidisoli]
MKENIASKPDEKQLSKGTQIINKSLQLNAVNEGEPTDNVLVYGADNEVKSVPRSEFGGGSQDLQQTLETGNIAQFEGGNSKVKLLDGDPDSRTIELITGDNNTRSSMVLGNTFASLSHSEPGPGHVHSNISATNEGITLLNNDNGTNGWYNIFKVPYNTTTQTTYSLPIDKPNGNYTLATTDEITGGNQNLQSVLDNGNIGYSNIAMFNYFASPTYINLNGTGLFASDSKSGASNEFANTTYNADFISRSIGSGGEGCYTKVTLNDSSYTIGRGLHYKFPDKESGTYTLATTSDLESLSSGSISGTPNYISKFNNSGSEIVDSGILDTPDEVTILRPSTKISSTVADYSGLKLPNISAKTIESTPIMFGTTGSYPWDMLVDNFGNTYLTDRIDSNVRKTTIDGVTTIIADTGAYPSGIVMDSKGNLFTVNRSASTITKIDKNGTVTTTWATLPNRTYVGIEIDEHDTMYVLGILTSLREIYTITPEGIIKLLASEPQPIAPSVYAFTRHKASGMMYILHDNGMIRKISPNGTMSELRTGSLNGAICLATDQNTGYIYAYGLSGTTNLYKIAPDGTTTILSNTVTGGWDLKVDNQSNVYTIGSNGVTKTSPNGISTVLGATAAGPQCLAVGGDGAVYVASRTNKVYTRFSRPTYRNSLIVDQSGNVISNPDFYTDSRGLGYLPSTLLSDIKSESTGKAIATKEYLEYKINAINDNAIINSSDTITLNNNALTMYYTYTGNAPVTWNLPPVFGNNKIRFQIINAGSGTITIQGTIWNSGTNETSLTVISGSTKEFYNNSLAYVVL